MPLPDSLPWMESTDAKLRRAYEHLEAYEREAIAFAEHARPTFIRKTNIERTEHWLVYYTADPFPPMRLSTIIGDCLYNMRSALDSLVYGLILKSDPAADIDRIQFPILDMHAKFPAQRGKLAKYVSTGVLAVIESLQPYHRPDDAVELDPLWIVNRLCNRDKHCTTLLTLCYHKDVELLVPLKDGGALPLRLPRTIDANQPDTIPLPCPVDAIADNVRLQIRGKTTFRFRLDGRLGERTVDELLIACLQHIEDRVVPRFRPFFR